MSHPLFSFLFRNQFLPLHGQHMLMHGQTSIDPTNPFTTSTFPAPHTFTTISGKESPHDDLFVRRQKNRVKSVNYRLQKKRHLQTLKDQAIRAHGDANKNILVIDAQEQKRKRLVEELSRLSGDRVSTGDIIEHQIQKWKTDYEALVKVPFQEPYEKPSPTFTRPRGRPPASAKKADEDGDAAMQTKQELARERNREHSFNYRVEKKKEMSAWSDLHSRLKECLRGQQDLVATLEKEVAHLRAAIVQRGGGSAINDSEDEEAFGKAIFNGLDEEGSSNDLGGESDNDGSDGNSSTL